MAALTKTADNSENHLRSIAESLEVGVTTDLSCIASSLLSIKVDTECRSDIAPSLRSIDSSLSSIDCTLKNIDIILGVWVKKDVSSIASRLKNIDFNLCVMIFLIYMGFLWFVVRNFGVFEAGATSVFMFIVATVTENIQSR